MQTTVFTGAQGRNRTGTGVAPQRILSRWGIHLFSTFSGIYSGQRRLKTTENDLSTAGKRWQWFAVLLLIFCALPSYASDYRLELGYGATKFGLQPDGTWYQRRFSQDVDTDSKAYTIGLSGPVWKDTRWRVAYVNFGATRANTYAVPDDANYNPKAVNGCNGNCLPLAHLMGYGNAYGFEATIQPGIKFGDHRVFVEAGPAYIYGKWIVQVENECNGWDSDNNCTRWNSNYTQDRMKGWNWQVKLGAGYEYKNVTLAYSYYPEFKEKGHDGKDEQGCVRNDPGVHLGAHMIEVRVSLK